MAGSRATVWVGLMVVAIATMWALLRADAARGTLPGASETAAPLTAAIGPDSAPASRASGDDPIRPPTITPSTRPTEPASLTVRGRIVDATRHPVDSAPVRLWQNGAILGETTSGHDGSFEMIADAIKPMALERTATLLAGSTDLGCGRFDIWIRTATPTSVVDTGIIALTDKLIRTTIHVTRDDHDAAAVPVSIPPYFRGITNTRGEVSVDLPPGRRTVIAGNTPDAIAVCSFDPATEPTLGVKLEPARSFTIVVRDAVTERPIPGARIEVDLGDEALVSPYVGEAATATIGPYTLDYDLVEDSDDKLVRPPIARLPLLREGTVPNTTDADGRAVFPSCSGTSYVPVIVVVTPPPGGAWRAWLRSSLSNDGTEIVVPLDPLPAQGLTHWPIAADSPVVPAEGVEGRVDAAGRSVFDDGSPNNRASSPAIIRSGELVVAFPLVDPPPSVTDSARDQPPFGKATMNGGLIALLPAPKKDGGAPIRFERGRHVNVRILDFAPEMENALSVILIDQAGCTVEHAVPANGTIAYDGIAPGQCQLVLAWKGPHSCSFRRLATYNLAEPDGTLDVTVGTVVTVTFDVTINGSPGIPGGLRIAATAGPVLRQDDDVDQGRIKITTILPGDGGAFDLSDYVTSGLWVRIPVDLASIIKPIPVRIGTNTSVVATVVAPLTTFCRLTLVTGEGARVLCAQVSGLRSATEHQTETWTGLPLGTYRVRDETTGDTSEPVTITPTAPVGRVNFDFARSGTQKVRVIMPRGFDEKVHGPLDLSVAPALTGVRQRSRGDGSSSGSTTANASEVAPFLVALPGDRPVSITPVHQYLHPARVGGRATVTTPGDDIQLTMEWNQRAFLRLKPDLRLTSPSRVGWVLVHDDADLTRWSASFDVFSDGDRLWFSGFKPGVFTLTLALWGRAPLRIDAADLTGTGDVDLGVVPFEPAAGALRVTVARRPKGQAGDLFVRLVADDPRVAVMEQRIAADQPELFLAELAVGKWHVTIVPGGQWIDTCRPEDKVEADVTINAGQETGITYPR